MRMLIQRVTEARVTVDEEVCGQIGPGLLVLLGIHKDDTTKDIPWMVSKLTELRIFADENGKMNRSIQDAQGQILVVSQFTLYGNCRNGRRPDFISSAKGDAAESLYNAFVKATADKMGHVETGRFGAYMHIHLINDGPVTFLVDSK